MSGDFRIVVPVAGFDAESVEYICGNTSEPFIDESGRSIWSSRGSRTACSRDTWRTSPWS
jgi:hypothetical protein